MKRFIRTELTDDMKSFVDRVAISLKDQKATVQDFKASAKEIAKRFLSSNTNQSVFNKIEKAILEYMIDQGYVNKSVLNAGVVDGNGIEVTDPDALLPKELASRRYGCRIQGTDEAYWDEVLEMLLDQDFLSIRAYKLDEPGVLFADKQFFFIHPQPDCADWARDIVADYPGFKVGKTFNVVWSQYYDIEVEDENSTKVIKYHKLK